jgi:hypothetical protein
MFLFDFLMNLEKSLKPSLRLIRQRRIKVGVQNRLKRLDSGLRRNDEDGVRTTFYETILPGT